MSGNTSNDGMDPNDLLILMFAGAFLVGTGAVSFGGTTDTLRPFLVDWKILATGSDILIPLGDDGTGIGAMPLLVLGGLLAILIVMLVARSRRRHRIK